jgi:uncharacterized metal-binding protein
MENSTCDCKPKDKVVITCSGAADVGYISDQVSRKLARNGHCKMSCMALFATCDAEKIDTFKDQKILVIDGCDEDCGKKVMVSRDIEDYSWLRITDLGYEKGNTPTSRQIITDIYTQALALLD